MRSNYHTVCCIHRSDWHVIMCVCLQVYRAASAPSPNTRVRRRQDGWTEYSSAPSVHLHHYYPVFGKYSSRHRLMILNIFIAKSLVTMKSVWNIPSPSSPPSLTCSSCHSPRPPATPSPSQSPPPCNHPAALDMSFKEGSETAWYSHRSQRNSTQTPPKETGNQK